MYFGIIQCVKYPANHVMDNTALKEKCCKSSISINDCCVLTAWPPIAKGNLKCWSITYHHCGNGKLKSKTQMFQINTNSNDLWYKIFFYYNIYYESDSFIGKNVSRTSALLGLCWYYILELAHHDSVFYLGRFVGPDFGYFEPDLDFLD